MNVTGENPCSIHSGERKGNGTARKATPPLRRGFSFLLITLMDNSLLSSPLGSFSYQLDQNLQGESVYRYYEYAESIPSNYMTKLFFDEAAFRYRHQLNMLVAIISEQGTGKSTFGSVMGFKFGETFEIPFSINNNTVVDFDQLDKVLHESPFRTTFLVDEQPRSFFGIGSSRVLKNLSDYEEMCRYTQKNIIWVSPTEREHSAYFLFKESDARPSVERLRNDTCLKCEHQNKCLKIAGENKFKTFCGIPFFERHGYPVAFNFLLHTKRKIDGMWMPRGFVRLPMLSPENAQLYDSVKKKNIQDFEQKRTIGWNETREKLKVFQEQYKSLIFNETTGKMANKDLIRGYLLDCFGGHAFTTTELNTLIAIVQAEIRNSMFAEKTMEGMENDE